MADEDQEVDINAAADAEFPAEPVTTVQPCQQRELIVSVRRDFPIRQTERFGDWGWSRESGDRGQDPLSWSLPSGASCATEVELTASRADAIVGWGIGDPMLGAPGRPGGTYTTDWDHPVAAEVRLRQDAEIRATARTTERDGLATLPTTGLSGRYTMEIVPDQRNDEAVVGPSFDAEAQGHELIYRSLEVEITLTDGALTEIADPYDPPAGRTHGRVGNHRAWAPSTVEVPISLKPIWWRHPRTRARAQDVTVDMFVLHCTSGARLGNALAQWLPRSGGAHYVLDVDGHLIKLAGEDNTVSHLAIGFDRWERDLHNVDNNDRSVGIEIVNPIGLGEYGNATAYVASSDEQPYTFEQYRAVIALGHALVTAFPGIAHRIIGHSDVACGPEDGDRYYRRRNFDPGNRFSWEQLEAAGLGMILQPTVPAPGMYDGVFEDFPGVALREGDRDGEGGRPGTFGAVRRPGYTGAPIAQLKADLRHIGYSLRNVNGQFDAWTAGAVDRFKRHFFSGSRQRATGGRVDAATALAIRSIASSI
jgi:N-acetyl-anhydromuramyl-L-alanine amidase AmpD